MSGILAKFTKGLVKLTQVGAPNGVAQLDADGKLPLALIPAGIAGGINFKGAFDASTAAYPANPQNGDLYMVSVSGTVNGTQLTPGDYVFYSTADSSWKVINTDRSTDDLVEGGMNLYFTAARARIAAVVNTLTGGATDQAPSVAAVAAALAAKADATTARKERFVLSAQDITNGYVDLTQLARPFTIIAGIDGLGLIEESTDAGATGAYSVADNGSGKTRLTWLGDLIPAGQTPLAAGDVIFVAYRY